MILPNQVIDECGSTNDLARELAENGAPHGAWISARRQTSGRGRLGRKWEPIEGNLFLSIIARPKTDPSLWSWIPLATALGITECLRDFNPALDVRIKWPNDLWIDRKKLGGILCEAVGARSDSFIVIGIGLNCVDSPEGLDQPTTSLTREGRARVDADEIRQPLIASVLEALETLGREGSAAILARYRGLSALSQGTEIEWKPLGTDQELRGIVEDVGTHGELLVRDPSGGKLRLFAEDVKVRLRS